jgi:hypothetical protein
MTKQEFMAMSLPHHLNVVVDLKRDEYPKLSAPMKWNHSTYSLMIVDKVPFLPILHPLSDLTKSIEHEGEVFVPMIKLVDPKTTEWDKMEVIEYNPFPKIWNHTLWYKVIHQELGEILQINPKNINVIPFYLLQQLVKMHFDITNLIEKGEAIDINTLENFKY